MQEQVSTRRQWVLKAIVEEYVATATPVSSESIARKAPMAVSTATLRHEMAALEDLGLLRHPHTSAGRMPSDAGYRYYVEHLMPPSALGAAELRTIYHQFHQVEFSVDQWLTLACAVLARALQHAALATPPLARLPKVRRVELVPLPDRLVLLVLLLQSGHIRQQFVPADPVPGREELNRLSNKLSVQLEGHTVAGVGRVRSTAPGFEQEVLQSICRVLEQAEQQVIDGVEFEGISHIVAQPEFAQSAKLQPIVEALEHGQSLAPMLAAALQGPGVRVIIGSEQPNEAMRECSVVLIAYGPDADTRGVVGVVGPTRMPYWRAVPLVRFVGGVVDNLVRESLRA